MSVVVDTQVHPYAVNSPEYPWVPGKPTTVHLPEVTSDQMVAAMDAVGVDRAIAVSPVRVYHFDASYAAKTYREHPDRFRLVAPVDPHDPDVTQRVEEWAATPGAVGVRIVISTTRNDIPGDHPGIVAAVKAATAADLAINVVCFRRLHVIDTIARSFPESRLVLDHLGMWQNVEPPAPTDPFADIDKVLALAEYPNLNIKVSGVCTYSHEPFPYADIREPVGRVMDAFGIERCMWGTDWTRALPFLTYEQGISAFRDHWPMPDADKAALLGENAVRIYTWDRF